MSIRIAHVTMEGSSAYSQSRYHDTPKKEQETHEQYRERTWREHMHYDLKTGEVYIPQMSIKNALSLAANRLGMKVAGRGAKTYSQYFRSGILVEKPAMLGIFKDDVKPESLFLPSDGKAGSGSRVMKTYPQIDPGWKATAEVLVIDGAITDKIFAKHMEEAGRYIGLGRFRPERGGYYGRFAVKNIQWEEAA